MATPALNCVEGLFLLGWRFEQSMLKSCWPYRLPVHILVNIKPKFGSQLAARTDECITFGSFVCVRPWLLSHKETCPVRFMFGYY
jgi:hypothetical protein